MVNFIFVDVKGSCSPQFKSFTRCATGGFTRAIMQEADQIILKQIEDLGCNLDEDIKSIKQFDADIVYKVCYHYIKVLDEAKAEALPEFLSKGMSARANSCANLAQAIKEVGYRGEMGFHQILYPAENDVRKLLIWFAQAGGKKILSEPTASVEAPLIGESIVKKMQLVGKEAWVPTRHKPTHTLSTTPLIVPSNVPKNHPSFKYFSQYLPVVSRQPHSPEALPASLFEHNLSLFSAAQEKENEWNVSGLDSGVSPEEYKKKKIEGINNRMANYLRAVVSADMGSVGEKQKDTLAEMLESFEQTFQQGKGQFARKKNFTNEVDTPAVVVPHLKETEEEKLRKQEAEIEELQKQLSLLQQEASQLEQETQSLVAAIRQFESRLGDEDTRRQTLEKEYKIKKKTAVLMENADSNIAELQEMSRGASQRLQELAVKWEEHRVPLVEEFRALKDAQMNKEDEAKIALEQIKNMRAQMKAWVAEIHQKDEHYKQLLEALEALPKDMTRAVYTRSILEIVKNVKKQKVDIDKILIDTRNLQKEINTVSDTLGRVFAVVDELVFNDANNKDATAVQAYKHIAGIDKSFKKLVSLIEETGQSRNNVLNLDAKIEQIQLRTNSLNTERLEKDLAEVKEENKALQAKLKK